MSEPIEGVPEAEDEGRESIETPVGEENDDADVEREMRKRTRRSFLLGGVASLAGIAAWRWVLDRRVDDGIPWPIRRVLEGNEELSQDYFSPARLAPTFPRAMAQPVRVNGGIGLEDEVDAASWTLQVEGIYPGKFRHMTSEPTTATVTLDEIKALPRVEMVTEFKCIEGWSQILYWAGARFVDFAVKYGPATLSGDPPDPIGRPDDLVGYVSM